MAGSIIWTNHLEERLKKRGITKNEAFDAIHYPDKSLKLSANKWKLFKNYHHKQVVIIASYKNGQWIIITSWSKAPSKKHHSGSEPLISRIVRNLIVKFLSSL